MMQETPGLISQSFATVSVTEKVLPLNNKTNVSARVPPLHTYNGLKHMVLDGFLLSCFSQHTPSRNAPDCHVLPCREVIERTGFECIEATVMSRILLHIGNAVRIRDERLSDIVMRGVMVRRKTTAGRRAGRLQHRVTENCSDFEITRHRGRRLPKMFPDGAGSLRRGLRRT